MSAERASVCSEPPNTTTHDQDFSVLISVVVPLFNERESLELLHQGIVEALEGSEEPFEIIYCDDGSSDGSFDLLKEIVARDSRARALRLKLRFGQTTAMVAGFEHAHGEIIVPIDADLQNDPIDIPRLLQRLEEGYDVVKGWRKHRKDPFFTVTLPSRLGNAVISLVTGVSLHDYGCTLTAYRREILERIELSGELHRFIPALAATVGARVTEMPVAHHPRRHGRSKYTLLKAPRVARDLARIHRAMIRRTGTCATRVDDRSSSLFSKRLHLVIDQKLNLD